MEEYIPPSTKIPSRSDKEYHVFLSFRGKDVRSTLVDRLFEALTAAGLEVFLDSHKFKKGEIIGLTLEKAIKSSAIRIPVFSRGYADSVWCLREAAAMVNTEGLIIPLFYDVEPTHLRYPQGNSSPYKQAFQKHYSHSDQDIEWWNWKYALQRICPCLQLYEHSVRYQREEIDRWKDALKEICSRSGWSKDSTGGFEAQLVKMVVNDVIKTFDRVPLDIAKHPVGLESVTEDLIHKFILNSEGGAVKAGIWGIGGIGKTTLAKALYNQVYAHFDASSFVFNIRTTAANSSMGLTKLQKKILTDLCKYGGEVYSVDEGNSMFRDRLRGKRVLLILDDVDAMEQLNALVGKWLAPGSRVVITSRNKHILHVAGVSPEYIHEMTGLQINESLQLFSWHAFLKTSPSATHENMSKKMVEACKDHPLSLEVMGAFLYDKQNDPGCWMEAFHNVTLHSDIHKTLYISYSALSEEEKEIFLDIACFFIGEHKKCPIVFWESLYRMVHTAISNLSLKLLIKIDDEGVFNMHDHLRDMGRTIAEKEKQGTRLWEVAQLSNVLDNINCSRLRFNGGNLQMLEMLYRAGLQFLHLKNLLIDGITEDGFAMLPSSLIWLRLENCSFAIHGPFHFSLVDKLWQLRIMQVDGNISNFFQYSLSNILGNLSQLQHLDLRGCTKLTFLPGVICNLSQLQYLGLSGCKNLNNLPHIIGNLSQLQHIDLSKCENLNDLPDTIGNLSKLQHLNLFHCEYLNSLPDTIGNLLQLQHLNLSTCTDLNNLPNTIGNLSQLQHLNLSMCTDLNNLPDTIGNLSQLQHLELRHCENLNSLPDTIGNLSQLQYLELNYCTKLNNLPDTIGNLSQLHHLNLSVCKTLDNLPNTIGNLSQLQHLDLSGCKKLNNLPDTIGNLSELQHLELSMCETLNNLPDTIGNLSQRQFLDLRNCENLNDLPDAIGNLSQLQNLELKNCEDLNNLPDTIGSLSQLQHLELSWCIKLNSLPGTISNLSQLQYLGLSGCKKLNNLPNTINNLLQLQHLELSGCKKINRLPNTIGNLSQLQYLELSMCENLNNLPDTIGNLSQLQQLKLKKFENLNMLPNTIGHLQKLQHLELRNCENLSNLPDTIGNLSQLQHLDLSRCTKLNNLPDTIGNLSQLQHLDLNWCTKLNNLPATIGNLSKLHHLELSGCKKLNNLPDTIGNLSQLQHLLLFYCKNLNNLPDTIGNLTQLQHLGLSGCNNLNNLPDTIGNLSQLQIENFADDASE